MLQQSASHTPGTRSSSALPLTRCYSVTCSLYRWPGSDSVYLLWYHPSPQKLISDINQKHSLSSRRRGRQTLIPWSAVALSGLSCRTRVRCQVRADVCCFQRNKWTKREPDHLFPSSVEVKNAWSFSIAPPYVTFPWCFITFLHLFPCSYFFSIFFVFLPQTLSFPDFRLPSLSLYEPRTKSILKYKIKKTL